MLNQTAPLDKRQAIILVLLGILLGAGMTWGWMTYSQPGAVSLPGPGDAQSAQVTVKTLRAGTGDGPTADDVVLVNYSMGVEGSANALDSGQQAVMPLSQVIAGFRDAVMQMRKGGKFRAHVPARLGYGERGAGPIPANADLWFEVELLDFMSRAQYDAGLRGQQESGGAPKATPPGAAPPAGTAPARN